MDYKAKQTFYTTYFSMGANTTNSLENKLELLHLICFLTNATKKSVEKKGGDPSLITPLTILEKIYNRTINTVYDSTGIDNYLTALAIICEDLLFSVYEVKPIENYKKATEIADKIKVLIEEWLPF